MIKYRGGYKYQLLESATFGLPAEFREFEARSDFIDLENGVLTLAKGYAWDGPSGPTMGSKSAMQGSLIHDALYQLMREQFIPQSMKAEADRVLYTHCVADGMWKWRAKLSLKAVNQFGSPATIHNKDVLVAP